MPADLGAVKDLIIGTWNPSGEEGDQIKEFLVDKMIGRSGAVLGARQKNVSTSKASLNM